MNLFFILFWRAQCFVLFFFVLFFHLIPLPLYFNIFSFPYLFLFFPLMTLLLSLIKFGRFEFIQKTLDFLTSVGGATDLIIIEHFLSSRHGDGSDTRIPLRFIGSIRDKLQACFRLKLIQFFNFLR